MRPTIPIYPHLHHRKPAHFRAALVALIVATAGLMLSVYLWANVAVGLQRQVSALDTQLSLLDPSHQVSLEPRISRLESVVTPTGIRLEGTGGKIIIEASGAAAGVWIEPPKADYPLVAIWNDGQQAALGAYSRANKHACSVGISSRGYAQFVTSKNEVATFTGDDVQRWTGRARKSDNKSDNLSAQTNPAVGKPAEGQAHERP